MKAYDDGKKVSYIGETYGVNVRTIRSIVERFKNMEMKRAQLKRLPIGDLP